MNKILNGKIISENILKDLKKDVSKNRLKLRLAVVLVGNSKVSEIFINQKRKACNFVGTGFSFFKFSSAGGNKELKNKILKITKDRSISGIIIQLPLPKKFSEREILNILPEEKDVDVLSEKSLGRYYSGSENVLPPVVFSVSQLLKNCGAGLSGKNVVVIGAGELVGKPLCLWLMKKGATVSVLNKTTKDILFFTKNADILISGAGKADLIRGNMVKKGAIVIDAGTSIKDGRLVGDVDYKSVAKKAGFITPVPGGVGPLTVAGVIHNLIALNRKK